jgi:phosphatidylinositol glycan class K
MSVSAVQHGFKTPIPWALQQRRETWDIDGNMRLLMKFSLYSFVLIVASSVHAADQMRSKHTSNWAVLVDASKFWLNYRHVSNILAFYHIIKRLGIPDSNIIVMAGDDMACNARNPYPACIYHNESHALNLYDSTVEVSSGSMQLMFLNGCKYTFNTNQPGF